jgi:amino acid transporter
MIKQVVVYAKVMLLVVLAVLIGAIVFKNRAYRTEFWPWAVQEEVPTLWLMLATSVMSIICFWIFTKVRSVFRDMAELSHSRKQEATRKEATRLKQELDEQERRIDQKLKGAIDESKE